MGQVRPPGSIRTYRTALRGREKVGRTIVLRTLFSLTPTRIPSTYSDACSIYADRDTESLQFELEAPARRYE